VVIGGASLSGGRGTIIGTFIDTYNLSEIFAMHMREKFDKDDRLTGTISSDRGEYPAKGELTTSRGRN